MKCAVFALSLILGTVVAEEITLQDILNIKEQIRNDREEIARLQEQIRGNASDREVDIAELKAVLTHQEEEIAQLNQEIAKAKKDKPLPQKKPQMGCAPEPACPPEPCCKPVCCPKEYKELPPPCERCPMMMRYYPAIEESQFAFRGEFLYWKTLFNPGEYALRRQVNIAGADTGAIGPYEVVGFDWDPAFRLAMVYRFCPDFWQAELQYTYLSNSGSDAVNGGDVANPAAGVPFLTGTYLMNFGEAASRASANIDLDYHILDFYVGRRFLLADSIIVKPLFGVGGAWISQDYDILYTGFGTAFSRDTFDWKYHAGGIKAGFTSDWFLWKGLGISTQLVMGGFVGTWETSYRNSTVTNAGVAQTLRNSSYEDTRFAFTTQFQIGLSWQWMFRYANLRLFAGYEMNPWFNIGDIWSTSVQVDEQQRFTRTNLGIVCPQGVTLNAKVSF